MDRVKGKRERRLHSRLSSNSALHWNSPEGSSPLGQIRVARGAQLDRESTPTITLEVTAHDTPMGGINQRKTTVIVSVVSTFALFCKTSLFKKYKLKPE